MVCVCIPVCTRVTPPGDEAQPDHVGRLEVLLGPHRGGLRSLMCWSQGATLALASFLFSQP